MGYTWMTEKQYTIFLVSAIILAIVMIINVVNNIIIIAGVVFSPVLQTPDNVLMANLAFADFVIGFVAIPMFILSKNDDVWEYIVGTRDLCKLFLIILYDPLVISLNMLDLMAIDRYISVFYPFNYANKQHKIRIAFIAVFGLWCLIGVFNAVGAFFAFKYNSTNIIVVERCNYVDNYEYWYQQSVALYAVISIVVCVVLTYKVMREAVRMDTALRKSTMKYRSVDSGKKKTSVSGVKINVYLLLIFLAFWLPLVTISALTSGSKDKDVLLMANYAAFGLGALNASVNGLVYAFLRRTNRRIYVLLLTTCPWRWGSIHKQYAQSEYRKSQSMFTSNNWESMRRRTTRINNKYGSASYRKHSVSLISTSPQAEIKKHQASSKAAASVLKYVKSVQFVSPPSISTVRPSTQSTSTSVVKTS